MADNDVSNVMIEDLERSLGKLRVLDLAKVPYEFRHAIRSAIHIEEWILCYLVFVKKNPGVPYPGSMVLCWPDLR